jgi:Flp pilus assembly protein TadB
MSSVVGDFLTRARGGMDLEEALDLLQHSLDHEHFQDLVLAIRFNFRHRGDLPALLEHLEWQLNRLEEEYVRRRLSNARDRNITGLLLLAVPLLYVWRLAAQPAVGQILWQNPVGRILSGLALLAYLAALSALLLIQKKIGR